MELFATTGDAFVRVGAHTRLQGSGAQCPPLDGDTVYVGCRGGGLKHSVVDPRFGHVVNHDFAGYHIAANADARSIEAHWLDEEDPYINPMRSKGIGEVCIVGTAAAIANAVHHATGVRVRDLPITLDKLL